MIYLDNAATSLLKPECVAKAVYDAISNLGNSGRGFYGESLAASRVIYDTRRRLGELFGAVSPRQVVFTSNATEALNTAIMGSFFPEKEPVHVITTAMEHNSVLRPLYALEKQGLSLTILPTDEAGNISYKEMESSIRKETKAIVCTHASNLTGNVNDIKRIGEIAKKYGLLFILDASQTAGVFPISMKKDGISILCASGHKGLLGPQGTGFLCVDPSVKLKPLKRGGTGVQTFLQEMPREMPEALEAGTLNGHGIAGLNAALKWIEETGIEKIHEREQTLARQFYELAGEIPDINIYGDFSGRERAAVVSLNVKDMDSGEIGRILMEDYGISVRSGGHCAPLMHEALGTKGQGAVRFSFSYFNTEEEILEAVKALKEISESAGGHDVS